MRAINLILFILTFLGFGVQAQQRNPSGKASQRIFIYGGDIELKFIEYVKDLSGKPQPRICYLPTASGDDVRNIQYWEYICRELGIEPHVLRVWIDSDSQTQSFEDLLLSMDAVVVGGGNTLNMLGIWRYQEIDRILKKALEKGIILSGGSAGSICWFKSGISDSRPVHLSVVDGLGFLPYTHCPHYNVLRKKELYDSLISKGELAAGYACDEHSGILFTDCKVTEAVSSNHQGGSYFVSRQKGKVNTIPLKSRILMRKGALSADAYQKEVIQKEIKDFVDVSSSLRTPLEAFVTVQKLFANGKFSEYHKYAASSILNRVKEMKDKSITPSDKDSRLSAKILAILVYGDFAAVVSKGKADFYSLWYFFKEQGEWKCGGEDIGGASPEDAEMSFREKAPRFKLN